MSDLDFDTTEIEPIGDEEEQMAEDAKVYAEYWDLIDKYREVLIDGTYLITKECACKRVIEEHSKSGEWVRI